MTLPNPWRDMRAHPDVQIRFAELPAGVHGTTNGVSRIDISWRLSQVERRYAVTHEMMHVREHHTCYPGSRAERHICDLTARWLIPLVLLGDALAYSLDIAEVASDIWVPPSALEDRLRGLTAAEHRYLTDRTAHHRETN